MRKQIKIISAKYISDYKIQFQFSDNTEKTIDFKGFLSSSMREQERKYLNKEEFKKFSIDYGDLIWNNFEMCFQAKYIYNLN